MAENSPLQPRAHAVQIQILKVNDLRTGVGKASGKPYAMQDAETVIFTETGSVQSVGVLMLPKDMTGDKAPTPGMYQATFTLGTDRERRVIAQVVTLQALVARTTPKAM